MRFTVKKPRPNERKPEHFVLKHRQDNTHGLFDEIDPYTFLNLAPLPVHRKIRKKKEKKEVEVKEIEEEPEWVNDFELDTKDNIIKRNAQWTETLKREERIRRQDRDFYYNPRTLVLITDKPTNRVDRSLAAKSDLKKLAAVFDCPK